MSAVYPASAELSEEVAAAVTPIADALPPTAIERLVASRARLRAALMDIAHPPPRPPSQDGGLDALKDWIVERVKSLPGADLVIDALEEWWKHHPLHAVGIVAEEASRSLILPVARRSPYVLILGSLVAGALFIVSKPWKWLLRPALFIGLVPQLAAQAVQHLPIESWLGMLNAVLQPERKTDIKANK